MVDERRHGPLRRCLEGFGQRRLCGLCRLHGHPLRPDRVEGPYYGIARITIDGGAPEYADFYDPRGWVDQQAVYSKTGLSNAAHTVKIEWTGTKNAASTGTRIVVDALDLIGTLTQASPAATVVRYEDTDTRLAWAGTWWTSVGTARSAGALKASDSAGSAAYVAFTGTRFDLIGTKAPTYGIARITIDGGAPEYADFSTPRLGGPTGRVLQDRAFNAAHTVKIEWTGTRTPRARAPASS